MLAELRPLVERFETQQISPAEWTHEAHIRVGLFYVLDSADPKSAEDRMRAGINALNASHGIPQTRTRGYHETLTVLWLHLIRTHWSKSPNWEDLWATLQDKTLPLRHYTKPRIMSWEARTTWLEPDLLPLS